MQKRSLTDDFMEKRAQVKSKYTTYNHKVSEPDGFLRHIHQNKD